MEPILIGTTDRTILVFIPDPASTTGAGKTGLAHGDITVTYTRVETDNDVVHNDVTSSLNALTNLTDAHNDWGWKEVSATLSKGMYRLDIADAVFASGAWYAVVQVTITSGTAAATPKAFMLVAYNPLDGVRLGLTALPNAAADAPGGLPISDAGGLDLDAKIGALTFTVAGDVDVNVQTWGGTAISTPPAVNATQISGDGTAADTLELFAEALDQATGQLDSGSLANGTITAAAIADNAIDAATFAADVDAEILSYLVDDATRIDASALNTATGTTIPAIQARLKWVVIVEGTIGATGNDTTHVHLPGLTYGNDEINGYLLVVYDVSENEYHWREITDWVLATELATVSTLPFTPQNSTDTYAILAVLANASVTGGDATSANQTTIINHLTDIKGGTFSGATDSLEAIRDRGDSAWITATGFSTHSAADVWAAGTRTLTAGTNIQLPSNGLANVTAWTVAITGNITGNLSGSVGSVTGNINTASGTIQTLDALDTAQDTQHSTTQGLVTTVDGVVDAILLDTGTDGVVVAAGSKTGYALSATGSAALTEDYAADGATATLNQILYMIYSAVMEFSISGTTLTCKKLDGSTTAMTVTLDDATNPTSRTRSG